MDVFVSFYSISLTLFFKSFHFLFVCRKTINVWNQNLIMFFHLKWFEREKRNMQSKIEWHRTKIAEFKYFFIPKMLWDKCFSFQIFFFWMCILHADFHFFTCECNIHDIQLYAFDQKSFGLFLHIYSDCILCGRLLWIMVCVDETK